MADDVIRPDAPAADGHVLRVRVLVFFGHTDPVFTVAVVCAVEGYVNEACGRGEECAV